MRKSIEQIVGSYDLDADTRASVVGGAYEIMRQGEHYRIAAAIALYHNKIIDWDLVEETRRDVYAELEELMLADIGKMRP